MEILFRAKNDVYAFSYYPDESGLIWMKSGTLSAVTTIAGGWSWQILVVILAVATV